METLVDFRSAAAVVGVLLALVVAGIVVARLLRSRASRMPLRAAADADAGTAAGRFRRGVPRFFAHHRRRRVGPPSARPRATRGCGGERRRRGGPRDRPRPAAMILLVRTDRTQAYLLKDILAHQRHQGARLQREHVEHRRRRSAGGRLAAGLARRRCRQRARGHRVARLSRRAQSPRRPVLSRVSRRESGDLRALLEVRRRAVARRVGRAGAQRHAAPDAGRVPPEEAATASTVAWADLMQSPTDTPPR